MPAWGMHERQEQLVAPARTDMHREASEGSETTKRHTAPARQARIASMEPENASGEDTTTTASTTKTETTKRPRADAHNSTTTAATAAAAATEARAVRPEERPHLDTD